MESASPATLNERIVTSPSTLRAARIKRIVGRTLIYLLLSIAAIIFFLPFYWVLVASFKTAAELRELPPTLDLAVNDVAAGDLNGDGRPDIVFSTGGNAPTYIGLVMQRADGSFAPMSSMGTYDIPHAVLVADVTGDGRVDVLVSHLGWLAVGIYVQAADGTLAAEQRFEAPYGCPSLDSLAVGDLDSDGLADIAYCDAVLRQRPQPAVGAAVGGGAQGLWLRSLSTPARR